MNNCNACNKKIKTSEKLICCIVPSCNLTYHQQCVNVTFTKPPLDWKCPICKSKLPKGDNNNTPIKPKDDDSSAILSTIDVTNINKRTKKLTELPDPVSVTTLRTTIIDVIKSELPTIISTVIAKELKPLKEEISELKKSLIYIQQEHSELKKKCENLNIKTNDQSAKIIVLESQISKLEREHEQQQQWSRLQNLEIVGIPEIPDESPLDIITALAKRSGVDLKPEDIDFAHRVQPQRPASGRARSIVLRLKTRHMKDKLLSATRKLHGKTPKEVGLGSNNVTKIYVNEHLTQHNKRLLRLCKVRAKTLNYNFVWTKNCRIFVRKQENTPPLKITIETDLNKIK